MQTESHPQQIHRPFSIAAADAADQAEIAVRELQNRLSLRNRDSGNTFDDEGRVEDAGNSEPRLCLSTCFPAQHAHVLPQDIGSHDSFGPDVMVHLLAVFQI